jgi:hypothetical protein
MGTKANVNDIKQDPQGKYEIIIWKGPVSGQKLRDCGADVPDAQIADDVEAEIWLLDGQIIKADINTWRKLGLDVKTVHCFIFDEDDTSPIGNGLPNVMRDSQMSVSAATRMTLDNASVTCGPQLEINTALLRTDQDVTAIEAYKNWYRDDDGPSAQFPAVRKIEVDGHLAELQKPHRPVHELRRPRDIRGRGDRRRHGEDAVRADAHRGRRVHAARRCGAAVQGHHQELRQLQAVADPEPRAVQQEVQPGARAGGDYNVIARGATSLIAKEVRGMQVDTLSQTLRPEELDHLDDRKLLGMKLATRDLTGLLVPQEEADRKRQAREQAAGQMSEAQMRAAAGADSQGAGHAFKNDYTGSEEPGGDRCRDGEHRVGYSRERNE